MGLGKTYSTKYLLDSNNSSGVAGQVLSTTSTGIDWVNANTVPGAGLWIESGNNIYNSNSGNVGIGTSSPGRKLEVAGDVGIDGYIYHNGDDSRIGFEGNDAIRMYTANSVRLQINSNGNVGIGTTSPSKKLEVAGSYKLGTNAYIQYDAVYPYTISMLNTASVGNLVLSAGTAASYQSRIDLQGSNTDSDNAMTFTTGDGVAMVVQVDGNVGVGTTSPQVNLHSNVSRASGAFTTQGKIYALEVSNSDTTAGNAVGINFGHGGYHFTNFIASVRTGTGANPKGDLVFGGRPSDNVTFVERMRILANGNVGIGTTSPTLGKLQVDGVSTTIAINSSTNTDSTLFMLRNGGANGIALLKVRDGGHLSFDTGANGAAQSEKMRIASNGNVGIGITGPQQKLHIVSTDGANIILNSNTGAENNGIWMTEGGVATPYVNGAYVHYDGSSNEFKINTGAASLSTRFTIARDTGAIKFNNYDSTNKTGTPTYILGTDSSGNVVKVLGGDIPGGGGTVTGSGTIGYIPKWTGSSALGDSILEVNSALPSSVIMPEYIRHRGDTNTYFGFHSNDTFIVATSNNEVMRITSSGNVGIGTTAPGVKLTTRGTSGLPATSGSTQTNGALRIEDGSTSVLDFGVNGGSGAWLQATNSGSLGTVYNLLLQPNGGNVGIGTTNPTDKLFIRGSNPNIVLYSDTTTGSLINFIDQTYQSQIKGNQGTLVFNTGGTSERMRITSNGNVGIGLTVPAGKLSVQGTGGGGVPTFDVINTSATTFNHSAEFMTPNMTDEQNNILVIGRVSSTKNAGYIGWKYKGGAGSNENILTFGHWGSDNLMNLDGLGNLGVGTESPVDHSGSRRTIIVSDLVNGSNFETHGNLGGKALLQSVGGDCYVGNLTKGTGAGTTYLVSGNGAISASILANGNVGIGVTSPERILHLDANGGRPIIQIDKGGDKIFSVGTGTSANDDDNTILQMFDEGTEKIRLFTVGDSWLNGGNVGIGTTSPDQKLHVAGTVKWEGVGTSGLLSGGETYVSVSQSANSYDLRLGYDTGDFTIKGDGKIGIGLTNPSSKLTVSSPLSTNGVSVDFQIDGGSGFGMRNLQVEIPDFGNGIRVISPTSASSDNTAMSFYQTTSQVGTISMTASATSFNTTSDYRLKENKEDISDAIERVKKLKPVKFNWIKEPNELKVDGFYAHELADVVPEAVTGKKDALDHEGNPAYQAIDQSKIVPLLAAALQKAIDKIEQLEIRIQTIENN